MMVVHAETSLSEAAGARFTPVRMVRVPPRLSDAARGAWGVWECPYAQALTRAVHPWARYPEVSHVHIDVVERDSEWIWRAPTPREASDWLETFDAHRWDGEELPPAVTLTFAPLETWWERLQRAG